MITYSDVTALVAHAEQNCKSHGARFTEKRKQVFMCLVKVGKAVSAYELIDHFALEYGYLISAMSMYRILEFLEKEHLVHRLNSANKYVACSHIQCEQSHTVPQFLICTECQKVEEVNISQSMASQIHQNIQNAGFQLVSHQLEMNCICDECRNEK